MGFRVIKYFASLLHIAYLEVFLLNLIPRNSVNGSTLEMILKILMVCLASLRIVTLSRHFLMTLLLLLENIFSMFSKSDLIKPHNFINVPETHRVQLESMIQHISITWKSNFQWHRLLFIVLRSIVGRALNPAACPTSQHVFIISAYKFNRNIRLWGHPCSE